jgi:hypothetical protein
MDRRAVPALREKILQLHEKLHYVKSISTELLVIPEDRYHFGCIAPNKRDKRIESGLIAWSNEKVSTGSGEHQKPKLSQTARALHITCEKSRRR